MQHILHLGLERFGPLDKNYTKFVDEIHAWKSVGEHFVKSEEFYDSIDGAQEWAKETMEAHRHDKREKIYTLEQLAGWFAHYKLLYLVGWVVLWLHARFLRRGLGVRSPPDASRPVTKLRIGTASAGDIHSLARGTNPPTASIVPRYGVA